MVVYSEIAFRQFVEAHKAKFPFNQVKHTRHAYHFKHLLVGEIKLIDEVLVVEGFFLRRTAMGLRAAQECIMNEEAWPVPPAFDDIVDHVRKVSHREMVEWGYNKASEWDEKVANKILMWIKVEIVPNRKHIYLQCLDPFLQFILELHYGNNSRHIKAFEVSYREHFDHLWEKKKIRDFASLAEKCHCYLTYGFAAVADEAPLEEREFWKWQKVKDVLDDVMDQFYDTFTACHRDGTPARFHQLYHTYVDYVMEINPDYAKIDGHIGQFMCDEDNVVDS